MKVDERELDRVQAIILSMTPEERRRPELIKGSRRLRIAKGSGTNVQQVNQLVKQFDQMRKLMKQIGRGKMPDLGAADAPGALTSASLQRRELSFRADSDMAVRLQAHPRGREEGPDLARRRRRPALPARRPLHRDPRPVQPADRAVDHRAQRGARPRLARQGRAALRARSASSCKTQGIDA